MVALVVSGEFGEVSEGEVDEAFDAEIGHHTAAKSNPSVIPADRHKSDRLPVGLTE